METNENKDPKDEQITNEDTAVTNKDGNNDLEQGKNQTEKDDAYAKDVDTIVPSTDDSSDPTPKDPEEEDKSNKGQGPKGEDL